MPRKPDPVTLNGRTVKLEPLELDRDARPLHDVSNGRPATLNGRSIAAYDPDELIWRYMYAGPFPDVSALRAYLKPRVDSEDGLCLCVFDQASGRQVGVVNYLNNEPMHLRIELGSIWYSPLVQRTGANTEATYLLLSHAFALGYRRVEWKCNARNIRSRHAAERMGFKLEGVLQSYAIAKGCNRDSAWFRMLDTEWPEARVHIEGLLSTKG